MILSKDTSVLKIVSRFFTLSLVYAIFRYHLIAGVSWNQLPLYVMNKVFALVVVLLLFYTVSFAKTLTVEKKESYYWVIAGLVLGHVLISLSLLSPEYYDKFFNVGKMHFKNELSILFGIATFIAFIGLLLTSLKGKTDLAGKFQKSILLLLAVHLFSMGVLIWIKPFEWHGAMPPISLVSFVVLIGIMFVKKNTKSPMEL